MTTQMAPIDEDQWRSIHITQP